MEVLLRYVDTYRPQKQKDKIHFRKETLDKAHKLFEGEKDYRCI